MLWVINDEFMKEGYHHATAHHCRMASVTVKTTTSCQQQLNKSCLLLRRVDWVHTNLLFFLVAPPSLMLIRTTLLKKVWEVFSLPYPVHNRIEQLFTTTTPTIYHNYHQLFTTTTTHTHHAVAAIHLYGLNFSIYHPPILPHTAPTITYILLALCVQ